MTHDGHRNAYNRANSEEMNPSEAEVYRLAEIERAKRELPERPRRVRVKEYRHSRQRGAPGFEAI